MNFSELVDRFRNSSRNRRLRQESQNWPEILADVSDWAMVDSEVHSRNQEIFQVRGTLAFTLNGERHYGIVLSQPLGESYAKDFLVSADKPTQMLVRYDPADPDEMFASAAAGELPFDVWVEWRD